jgi:peptidyl-prolyl cis-trans isomerase C
MKFTNFNMTAPLAFAIALAPIALLAQTPSPIPPPSKAKPAPVAPGTVTPKPAAAPAEAAPAPLPEPTAVILQVGDVKITRADYESFIAGLPDRIQAEARGPNKRKVAEQIADVKLMAIEARKRKIDQEPKNKSQIDFQTDNLLASILYRDMQTTATADDASLKAYYDTHKTEYEQAKARHILIRFQTSKVPLKPNQKDLTDEEALAKANEIKAKLAGGADFATLAKAESDDTGSGAAGGDLGTFGHGQMVPVFEQAAFTQPIGKVGDPVKSPFGYHLIIVDERKAKTFEEVKPDIEGAIKPDMAKKAVEDLKKSTKVVVDDAYFGKTQ